MKVLRIVPILAAVAAASLCYADLNVGDKAPALKVSGWVKGKPVTLGKGRPAVVEFWATWCGPCRQSIPHLTELAKKYAGKVDFVGVSVWERDPADYTTKVPAFVKDFGAKMDYNVAAGGPDTFMQDQWMAAAGERGIPSAFLVDGAGRIAWIGHPMGELDANIEKLLAGKLNIEEIRAKRAEAKAAEANQMAERQALQKKAQALSKALQAKDYKAAVAEVDKLVAEDPSLEPRLFPAKIMAMVEGKLDGLAGVLNEVGSKPFAQDALTLNSIIWSVVEKPLGLSSDVYAAAVGLGEKMMKLTPDNAMNMDTYALALWRADKKADALAVQRKAVTLAKADKSVDAQTVKEMEARLKEFGG